MYGSCIDHVEAHHSSVLPLGKGSKATERLKAQDAAPSIEKDDLDRS